MPGIYQNMGLGTPAFIRVLGLLAFIRTLASSPGNLLLLFALGLC